jgi:RNA polymerase sigma-70 factor (ECF subfamily)
VLIAAWRDVRGLRDPAAWESWTYRLTVWACYRLARKERRRSLVELHVAPDHEPVLGPDAAAAFADHDMVMRWLDGLTIDHRAVLVLRFYRDLSVEEVAKVLDIPVGTVKSRIYRALGVLRVSGAGQPGSSAALFREGTV